MNFFKILFSPITAPISFIQNHFKATLLILFIIYTYQNSNSQIIQKPNLQEIELNGAIMDATPILEKIEKAKNDKNIKGILFVINSPGGAVAPSVEISYAIKELNQIKPVIAYASGTMASGSYYSAIWAKKIIANPGSMIGSIGVIMQSVDISSLMKKIGIKTQTVKSGEFKEAGTFTRKWTTQEKNELNKVIKNTYNMFVKDVATARKLKLSDQNKYANAHIFTSQGAKKVGLIDEVNTINYAKKLVQQEANISKPIWNKKDKIEKLFDKIITKTISYITINSSTFMATY